MRILKGSLTETVYGWPCERAENPRDCAASPLSPTFPHRTEHTCSASSDTLEPHALNVKRSTVYERGQVTYMSDRLGLHRIQNASPDEVAVSLHLYTVSSAKIFRCCIAADCYNAATQCRQARLPHLRPADGEEE